MDAAILLQMSYARQAERVPPLMTIDEKTYSASRCNFDLSSVIRKSRSGFDETRHAKSHPTSSAFAGLWGTGRDLACLKRHHVNIYSVDILENKTYGLPINET